MIRVLIRSCQATAFAGLGGVVGLRISTIGRVPFGASPRLQTRPRIC